MPLEEYIRHGQERLRCGYTTGSCATLGAKACGEMLLSKSLRTHARICTPKGIWVEVSLDNITLQDNYAGCSVEKDGGDDVDVTHGANIFVEVCLLSEPVIQITGGVGIGKVTKTGLNQPVGEYAINSVPRQMISNELHKLKEAYSYTGGFLVTISIPNGEALAKHTFNASLGIIGGLSILGTTGIVEPKSAKALLSSIEAELKMHKAQGVKQLILTPGNYGTAFLREWSSPLLESIPQVQISNFLGDSLDLVALHGFEQVLLVGHIGKMVKVAGGIMQTHSLYADGRMEILSAYASLCGGSPQLIAQLMASVSTDACLDLLEDADLLSPVMEHIHLASEKHLQRRAKDHFTIGMLMFSQVRGQLGISPQGLAILKEWEKNEASN